MLDVTQTASLDREQRDNRDILFRLNPQKWREWTDVQRAAARHYLAARKAKKHLPPRRA